MSDAITYPAPEEHETGVEYWERVRQLGLPFPWGADQSLPPGEVEVTTQWAVKTGNYYRIRANKSAAYAIAADLRAEVVRRIQWESAGPWEEVS